MRFEIGDLVRRKADAISSMPWDEAGTMGMVYKVLDVHKGGRTMDLVGMPTYGRWAMSKFELVESRPVATKTYKDEVIIL